MRTEQSDAVLFLCACLRSPWPSLWLRAWQWSSEPRQLGISVTSSERSHIPESQTEMDRCSCTPTSFRQRRRQLLRTDLKLILRFNESPRELSFPNFPPTFKASFSLLFLRPSWGWGCWNCFPSCWTLPVYGHWYWSFPVAPELPVSSFLIESSRFTVVVLPFFPSHKISFPVI